MRTHGTRRISRLLARGWRRGAGFTLVELLVVIIVIAILAAIAIPTYLGQRAKAQDTAAYTLVRNGLTVIQSVCIDTGGYTPMTADILNEAESTIHWVKVDGTDLVTLSDPPAVADFEAKAAEKQVAFHVESNTRIDLASESASGNIYAIQVDAVNLTETAYVQVKVVAGEGSQFGW